MRANKERIGLYNDHQILSITDRAAVAAHSLTAQRNVRNLNLPAKGWNIDDGSSKL